jgi:hypothetical protein
MRSVPRMGVPRTAPLCPCPCSSPPRTVGAAAAVSLCLTLATLCTLCSPREFAGDYDISRYRTIYGSPRSSSSEEGPTYNEEEEGDDDGAGGGQSGGEG